MHLHGYRWRRHAPAPATTRGACGIFCAVLRPWNFAAGGGGRGTRSRRGANSQRGRSSPLRDQSSTTVSACAFLSLCECSSLADTLVALPRTSDGWPPHLCDEDPQRRHEQREEHFPLECSAEAAEKGEHSKATADGGNPEKADGRRLCGVSSCIGARG